MRNRLVAMFIVMTVLCVVPALSSAAEDLFDTKTAAALVEKGIAQLKAGHYDAAIKEFEESSDINPDAEAFYYLGYAYYMKAKQGDKESRQKSMESFDKAYELDPHFTPTKFKPAEPAQASGAAPVEQLQTTQTNSVPKQ